MMTVKEAFRVIAGKFHGFEERPHQLEMAEGVEAAIADSSHIVVEAGTGIGKSMAYLVPFIEWAGPGRRVVVSTYTKALQRQLFEKDIPFVIETLGADIRCALCVGGENYICQRRLNQCRNMGLFEQHEGQEFEELLLWQFTTKSGLRSDLPSEPSPRLWQKVRREGDLCLGKRCRYYEHCFYQEARRFEKKSQILVTNHHLFFANIASGGHILPSFNAVIFDEGHELESVASTYLGLEVSNYRLKYLLDAIISPAQKGLLPRLRSVKEEDLLLIDSMVQEARKAGDHFFAELSGKLEKSPVRIREAGFVENRLARPLVQLASLLEELQERVLDDEEALEIKALSDRCLLLTSNLNCIITHSLDEHVYWAERGERRLKVAATPLDISATMKSRVFDAYHPVVMTSATLTTNNSFDFFRERIGLEGGRQLVIDSPFDYGRNVLLYLPQDMADPAARDSTKGPTFEGDVLKSIHEILEVTGGRTLALFTSHNLLKKAHGALQSLTSITTLRQGEHDSYHLINLFKESNDSVLLGTTTFWQGIDIPGNDLECVIITKLPFQNPDDPVVEARVERLLKEGKDPFNSYQVPQAILLFRQGFGRLIRRTDDRGVVAILDPRVKTKSYGPRFLNSIPRCRRSDSLDEVKGFLGVEGGTVRNR